MVAGGDGTVHLAIQELAGTGVPLGIIPAGTGNDIATALGLRELDAEAAADAIAAGRTRLIDLARVTRGDGTTAFFGTVLASGFDSQVNDRANAMRWPRGGSRYNIAILIEFLTLQGHPVRGRARPRRRHARAHRRRPRDGDRRQRADLRRRHPDLPRADLADGLLDVTLVRPAGRLRLLRLLPRVYRGTHVTVPEVSTYRVRRCGCRRRASRPTPTATRSARCRSRSTSRPAR